MRILKNYIAGDWVASFSDQSIDVVNPALQEVRAKVPYGPETKKDVAMATESAANAFKEWRTVPVMKRVQVLPLPWPNFHLVDGKIVSLEIYMGKVNMP